MRCFALRCASAPGGTSTTGYLLIIESEKSQQVALTKELKATMEDVKEFAKHWIENN